MWPCEEVDMRAAASGAGVTVIANLAELGIEAGTTVNKNTSWTVFGQVSGQHHMAVQSTTFCYRETLECAPRAVHVAFTATGELYRTSRRPELLVPPRQRRVHQCWYEWFQVRKIISLIMANARDTRRTRVARRFHGSCARRRGGWPTP